MDRPDDEFEDFLTRRKPIFSRAAENPLEPPDELDRAVLRQAREAIQLERPARVYRGPRWGAPLAVAATLLVAITLILNLGVPTTKEAKPEVVVQSISQRVDLPAAPESAAPAPPANNSAAMQSVVASNAAIDLDPAASVRGGAADSAAAAASAPARVSEDEASPYASGQTARSASAAPAPPTEAERAMAKASPAPAFRRDSNRWLAEIERLRTDGKTAQADAELAEYKREHRAYATSPER